MKMTLDYGLAAREVSTACRMQEAITKLEQWCIKWRVTLSQAKSQLILFTKCFRRKDEVNEIAFFQEQIAVTAKAKFLGIIFDSRFTWEAQFRKKVSKYASYPLHLDNTKHILVRKHCHD